MVGGRNDKHRDLAVQECVLVTDIRSLKEDLQCSSGSLLTQLP